jgi:hypothetical protein
LAAAADSYLEVCPLEDAPSPEVSALKVAYALETVCILGVRNTGSHKQACIPNQGRDHGSHGKRLKSEILLTPHIPIKKGP